MRIYQNASLLPFNTFGIDVKADFIIEYNSVTDLQDALHLEMVRTNQLLSVGSGSNLLFLNDFKGVILHSAIQSIEKKEEYADSVYLEVGSGVIWDEFVAFSVENGWGGVENLSLIPGETGAAAVQNIGAYGIEVQDVIIEVNAVEIKSRAVRTFSREECNYGYRESIFKNGLKGKYIITSVVFRLSKQPVFKLNYQHLEEDVMKNGTIDLKAIRKIVIALRQSKLPDPKEYGNAGSFFMNPIVSKPYFLDLQAKYPQIPHYYVSETEEKLPAGWLIDQCGWKGKQAGHAAVHDKQALVLINKSGATGAEIVHLAEQIQASVQDKFGIQLKPEVNYI